MKTAAIISAAGMSTRMGDFKQLMMIGGITLIEHVVVTFQRAGINDIVVVTGHRHKEVEKTLSHYGVTFLHNAHYETTEMFDSVKIGLSYIKDRCDRTLFCPADVPFFTLKTLNDVLNESADFIQPMYKDTPGHPIIIRSSLIPALLSYDGQGGMRGALEHMGIHPTLVNTNDAAITIDADTKDDYEKLQTLHDKRTVRPVLQVALAKEKAFFGPGTLTLLKHIKETGSVAQAAKNSGMSYSKAWKLIKDMEEGCSFKVVKRSAGGAKGGKATLTKKGQDLIERYILFSERLGKAAEEMLADVFSEY